jgi:hypothetical protein
MIRFILLPILIQFTLAGALTSVIKALNEGYDLAAPPSGTR